MYNILNNKINNNNNNHYKNIIAGCHAELIIGQHLTTSSAPTIKIFFFTYPHLFLIFHHHRRKNCCVTVEQITQPQRQHSEADDISEIFYFIAHLCTFLILYLIRNLLMIVNLIAIIGRIGLMQQLIIIGS